MLIFGGRLAKSDRTRFDISRLEVVRSANASVTRQPLNRQIPNRARSRGLSNASVNNRFRKLESRQL
ncbi:hypothetical protein [Nostoc sp.]|uniref:hypothetical protein n=1 Tax=Nostoc sp. TaxID=1180 RepID=UPI002FFAF9E4